MNFGIEYMPVSTNRNQIIPNVFKTMKAVLGDQLNRAKRTCTVLTESMKLDEAIATNR